MTTLNFYTITQRTGGGGLLLPPSSGSKPGNNDWYFRLLHDLFKKNNFDFFFNLETCRKYHSQ